MADIFISYARADREKIEKLASALEAEGYSVWWDRQIVGGAEFSKDIERELEAAQAVIVVWSQASVESAWVKDEALTARDDQKLVPVSIDATGAPMGFKQYHVLDLSSWQGDTQTPAFKDLTRAVQARVSGASAEPAPTQTPTASDASPAQRKLTPPMLIAAGLGVVALIAIALLLRLAPNAVPANDPMTAAPQAQGASIAVLPFVDLSEGQDQEFFSDGISEEILNVLVRIPNLKVAGRTSSFSFKGRNEDLREIGAALGVNHVLEGSVRRSGEKLRITAQLIRSEDGFHLWSETFDRELTDIFEIQDEIAGAIADQLALSLGLKGVVPSGKGRTDDPVAYENYLKAKQLIRDRGLENLDTALLLLQESTSRDPEFAPAWVGIATAYVLYESYAPGEQAEREYKRWRAIGRAAVERALALDAENAGALIMRSQLEYYERDLIAAMEDLDRAVALSPDDAEVLDTASQTLYYLGYFAQARQLSERAVAVDPLSAVYYNSLGNAVWAQSFVENDNAGFATAITHYEKVMKLNPQLPYPYNNLLSAYIYLGRFDEMMEIARAGERRGIYPEGLVANIEAFSKNAWQGDDDLRSMLDNNWNNYFKKRISKRLNDADAYIAIALPEWENNYQQEMLLMHDLALSVYKDPRWKAQVVKSSLLDLWRARGFPEYCRPLGDNDFECG